MKTETETEILVCPQCEWSGPIIEAASKNGIELICPHCEVLLSHADEVAK